MTTGEPLPESDLIQLCLRAVPQDAHAAAARVLLDWLGCACAARGSPPARAIARGALGASGDLLATAMQMDAHDAQATAFAGGALGCILEMDDLHRAALLHAGDTVCPAALAVALRRPVSGDALLNAIARGYEAAVRISLVAASRGYTPFYNTGTCGVFGAAFAAGDLLQLDEDALADALGHAGMQAAGLWQCRLEPTMSKPLAGAHAARAGVLSAQLAKAGLTGPRAILTGPLGFFESFYPDADRTALTASPEAPHALMQVSFKPWPACRHTHPAIGAALSLRKHHEGDDLPARVDVLTYRAALAFCDAPQPATPDAARFSLQHAVAVAIVRGAPGIADFEGDMLDHPAVAELRTRITLHCDPELDMAFPGRLTASVAVTDAHGRVRKADCPAAWGDPENPMTVADLDAKFRANAAHGGLETAAADAIIDAVRRLDRAPTLDSFADALTRAVAPFGCPTQETA